MEKRPAIALAASSALLLFWTSWALAHQPHQPGDAEAAEGLQAIDWHAQNVSRVLSQGWVDSFDIFRLWPRPEGPRVRKLEGRNCITGGFFSFDIDDRFAFDLDEPVKIELEVDGNTTRSIIYDFDQNGPAQAARTIDIPQSGSRWQRVTLNLDRARFANLGQHKTDFAVGAPGAAPYEDPKAVFDPATPHELTICSLKIFRSFQSSAVKEHIPLEIQVKDETGKLTPAQVGIYDEAGRAPLPSTDAVPIERYGDLTRLVQLRLWKPSNSATWFHDNRWVFHIGGRYRTKLPAGRYDIIVAKGPEYRVSRISVDLSGGRPSSPLIVDLKRWSNLAEQGWMSGDDHIHLTRKKSDDDRMLTLAEAMDLNVANLMRMGNLETTAFEQYAYGREGLARRGRYSLVSGQEDPRTGQRGHTLHLNIDKPFRSPDYFIYKDVLEEMHGQGAVSGYAHFGEGHFNDRSALALDITSGLVSFVEILQFGEIHLNDWYDFLNLGFKLAPTAGADWPYGNLPGTERVYAHTGGSRALGAWFAAVRAGNSFVTNGPELHFTVNGQIPGSELHLKKGDVLSVAASARQNPDFDHLDRLELVVHGEVIAASKASGDQTELVLTRALHPTHGMWLAVRAYGRKYVKAHSAPVYVTVDGDPSWKRSEVPQIAESMREAVRHLVSRPGEPLLDLEYWATHPRFRQEWERQLPRLKAQAAGADIYYEDLIRRSKLNN